MIRGLTDIHQHLLWGMDDGARTPEEMYAMIDESKRQGITKIAATVHVCPGFVPFDAEKYRERLAEAQEYCRKIGGIEVVSGAETGWTFQTKTALVRKEIPTLGDSDMVLIELWRDISLAEAKDAVRAVIGAGYCPVIAHIERYRCFCWTPRIALKFRGETGALFQVNANTLLNPQNFIERRFLRVMLRRRGIDAVATDAHGTAARPVNLRAAYRLIAQNTDKAYAKAVTNILGEN